MKTITVLLACLISVSALQAQTLSLGPTAGFGHSWLSFKNSSADNEFYPSYNGGIKLVYSSATNWGASADVKFSGEGGEITATEAGTTYEYKYRANYIRVPLQGIYFFGKLGDAVRPKISLGPSFGFLIGGDISRETGDTKTDLGKTRDAFESFDVGVNGAVGANFRLGGGKWLNADITYYHGLTDISQISSQTIKNRNIGINVGVLFPLGSK